MDDSGWTSILDEDDSLYPLTGKKPSLPSWWLNQNFGTFRHFTRNNQGISLCSIEVFLDYNDVDGFLGDLTEYMKQYKARKTNPEKNQLRETKWKNTQQRNLTMKALPCPKPDHSESHPSGSEQVHEKGTASGELGQNNVDSKDRMILRNQSFSDPEKRTVFEGSSQEKTDYEDGGDKTKRLSAGKVDPEGPSNREKNVEYEKPCGNEEKTKREENMDFEKLHQKKQDPEGCRIELEPEGSEWLIGRKRKGDLLECNKRKRLETMAYSS